LTILQINYLCNEKYEEATFKAIYLFPHLVKKKNYYINLFILHYQKHLLLKVVISFHHQFVASCFPFWNLGNSQFHLLEGGERFEWLEVSAATRNGL